MVDETGVDEPKVDETAVDETAVDEPGPHRHLHGGKLCVSLVIALQLSTFARMHVAFGLLEPVA